MIALPVIGLSAADIVIRTSSLDGPEIASRTLGTADLGVIRVSDRPITQTASTSLDYVTDGNPPADPTVDPTLLPAGSVSTPYATGSVRVLTRGGERDASAVTLDSTSPLTRGIIAVIDGRLARTAGEVAISPTMSERTGAMVGGQLKLAVDGSAYTVVGIAADPDATTDDTVVAQPGALPLTDSRFIDPTADVLLVGLPPETDALAVGRSLNARGIAARQRSWLLDPPPMPQDPRQVQLTVGLTVVTVGLALLQVVLLAGAAFAVGASRQRRALGLLAATGATGRDVGRSVLAGGLILGGLAAVLGVAVGAALAWPLGSAVQRLQGVQFGAWHVRPAELAVVAALGLLTGVLAALAPARAAARQDPLRALMQRPDPPRSGRRLTVGGLGLAAIGLTITLFGSTRQPSNYAVILTGAVLVELGFVLCAPALVGAAGRLARPLPVPLRMALRDASRHRSRSGPAVAAVMAALAGVVALSIFFVSQNADAANNYIPTALPGQVKLDYFDTKNPLAAMPPTLLNSVRAAVPGATLASWQPVQARCETADCSTFASFTPESTTNAGFPPQPVIGGPDVLRAALRRPDASAEQALARGEVVLLVPGFTKDGQALLQFDRRSTDGSVRPVRSQPVRARTFAVPQSTALSLAVMNPLTAADLGLTVLAGPQYLLDPPQPPTADQVDRLTTLSDGGQAFQFSVEAGYNSPAGPVLLALLGASVVVVLGATGIATGLAAADGRADLSTLAAVGAAPRTRRLLAMSQAAVVAFLGAALGAVAGFVPAAALVSTLAGWPLTIPWLLLAGTLLVVPALAAGFAGVLTRSRLPMLRRTA